MEITIIMDNLDLAQGGGVGSFVYDLTSELATIKGNHINLIGIVGLRDPQDWMLDDLRHKNIRIYDLKVASRKKAIIGINRYLPKLHHLLLKLSTDKKMICNLHLKLGVLYGTLASKGITNVKCVETYHSLYSHYWLENKVLSRFISTYVPCSNSAEEEFIRRFQPKKDKVFTIPNGVNGDKIRKSVEKTDLKNTILALSVGRLSKQKNFAVTARAFSKMNDTNFKYKIIGEGEEEHNILAQISSKNVILHAPVTRQDVLNDLANCDIVVMPSLWEGLSIFMLEAIALSCPMMISDVPSLRDVFEEKPLNSNESWRRCSWGYLVSTNDSSGYYNAMTDFLQDSKLKRNMRENVQQLSNKYDIQKTAKSYMHLYKKIIEN